VLHFCQYYQSKFGSAVSEHPATNEPREIHKPSSISQQKPSPYFNAAMSTMYLSDSVHTHSCVKLYQ